MTRMHVLSAGDKIKMFGEQLKRVAEGFETMKTHGIDEDILIAYLCHKMRISEKQVKEFLKNTEAFYEKLIKEGILDQFEKDNKENLDK